MFWDVGCQNVSLFIWMLNRILVPNSKLCTRMLIIKLLKAALIHIFIITMVKMKRKKPSFKLLMQKQMVCSKSFELPAGRQAYVIYRFSIHIVSSLFETLPYFVCI